MLATRTRPRPGVRATTSFDLRWPLAALALVACAAPRLPPPSPPPVLTPAPPDTWQTYGSGDGLPSSSIAAIAADASGGIWAGTSRGAARFDGTAWTAYAAPDGPIGDVVLDVAVDSRGTVWFGIDRGISRFDGHDWTHYTEDDGLPAGYVQVVEEDRAGRVWFGITGAGSDWAFGNGATRLDDAGTPDPADDRWQVFPPTRDRMGGGVVSAIADLGDVGIWFGVTPEGTVRAGERQGGVWRLRGVETPDPSDDEWTPSPLVEGPMSTAISAIALAPSGEVWIGTVAGLLRLRPEDAAAFAFDRAQAYTAANGLPGDRVLALAIGPDGRVWVGTDLGLAVIGDDRIGAMTTADGLPSNTIRDIALSPDGSVWVATPEGVGVLR